MLWYLFIIQYLHQGWDLFPDSSSKGHIRVKRISSKLHVSNKLDGKMQYAIPPSHLKCQYTKIKTHIYM